MEGETQNDGSVGISFNKDEALVLFEWLSRFNNLSNEGVFEDNSEQRVLWDLESIFEKELTKPFMSNYKELVLKAREKIKDSYK